MDVGAPQGNNNAGKNKPFWSAIDRAIAQDDGARLRKAAEALLDAAAEGKPWALREIADRLDGRPAQVIAGDSENPLTLINKVERVIVNT